MHLGAGVCAVSEGGSLLTKTSSVKARGSLRGELRSIARPLGGHVEQSGPSSTRLLFGVTRLGERALLAAAHPETAADSMTPGTFSVAAAREEEDESGDAGDVQKRKQFIHIPDLTEEKNARGAARAKRPTKRSATAAIRPVDSSFISPIVTNMSERRVGVAVAILVADWRAKRKAPPCFKLPNGEIRIRRIAFENWLSGLEEAA